MKEVMHFGKNGKISPQYVGPYLVLKRVFNVTYKLEFPSSLSSIHLVFYVLMLIKCVGDPSTVVPLEEVGILDSLS